MKGQQEVLLLNLDDNSYTAPGKAAHKLPEDMTLQLTTAEREQTGGEQRRHPFLRRRQLDRRPHLGVAGPARVAHQRRLADRRHRARRASSIANFAVAGPESRSSSCNRRRDPSHAHAQRTAAAGRLQPDRDGRRVSRLCDRHGRADADPRTSMHSARQSSRLHVAALWAQSKLDTVGVGEPSRRAAAAAASTTTTAGSWISQQVDPSSVEPPPQARGRATATVDAGPESAAGVGRQRRPRRRHPGHPVRSLPGRPDRVLGAAAGVCTRRAFRHAARIESGSERSQPGPRRQPESGRGAARGRASDEKAGIRESGFGIGKSASGTCTAAFAIEPNRESRLRAASPCSKSCSRSCCSRCCSPAPMARSARRCTRCIRARPRSIAPTACASRRNSCATRSAASCRWRSARTTAPARTRVRRHGQIHALRRADAGLSLQGRARTCRR